MFKDTFNISTSPITPVKLAVQFILKNIIKSNIENLDDYNINLLKECENSFSRKLRKYNYTIRENHNEEKYHMLDLPQKQIEVCSWKKLKASSSASIILDGHYKYYIAPKHANFYVFTAIFSDKIIVYDLYMNIISQINRKLNNNEMSINWKEYLNLFLIKPGAITNSGLFKLFPDILKNEFKTKNRNIKIKHLNNIIKLAENDSLENAIKVYTSEIIEGKKNEKHS